MAPKFEAERPSGFRGFLGAFRGRGKPHSSQLSGQDSTESAEIINATPAPLFLASAVLHPLGALASYAEHLTYNLQHHRLLRGFIYTQSSLMIPSTPAFLCFMQSSYSLATLPMPLRSIAMFTLKFPKASLDSFARITYSVGQGYMCGLRHAQQKLTKLKIHLLLLCFIVSFPTTRIHPFLCFISSFSSTKIAAGRRLFSVTSVGQTLLDYFHHAYIQPSHILAFRGFRDTALVSQPSEPTKADLDTR